MTDCSSIQGSTTSSSSDVTTLTTASSWCSISPSSRIRVLRLVRPHPRRILVTPNNSPSYGFSVRGGKEFGTGFFVSNIERYSEADHKGLKTGDQIIRVNGYRVEDAVHKELVQFISSQDRLTLKVRGVGVLPMKEKENDPLTWHVVRTATSSIACSEDSIKSVLSHRNRSKDVRVVLNVAPRTKLGLGICKGPEWKPGIFVQFTKEKSVARESGLRPGDQILCVNSIDFSDVLFSEAVAVMKSSTKLDMVVRTAAGCDLFPGESSGYNSSASSVTGDQSPCWADVSSKRLTVVCEESPANCNDQLYADVKKNLRSSEQDKYSSSSSDTGTLKERNKTIIKLSENGTSINNTYIENVRVPTVEQNTSAASNDQNTFAANDGIKPIPPPPPPFHSTPASSSASVEASQKLADICFVSRQSETKTVIVEVHRSDTNIKKPQQLRFVSPEQTNSEKASRIQSEEQGDVGSSKGESNQSGGNTLCSAIAEELRKRKEKQRNNDHQSNHISNNGQMSDPAVGHNESNLSTKIKSQRRLGHVANSNNSERNCDDQHSALMNEFKRAHQRMFKNGFHENDHKERQDVLKNTIVKDYKEDKPTVAQQPNSGENTKLSADFADAKVTNVESSTEFNGNLTYQNSTVMSAKSPRYESQKPPTSPTPDYEQVLVQGTIPKQMQMYSNMHLRNDATTTGNRRTMRLGTVTIGEYNQHQQKDPVKFEFLDKKTLQDSNRATRTEDSSTLRLELQDTLSRSNLRKNTSFSLNEPNGSGEVYEHQSHCQLQNNNSNNNSNNNKECTNVEKLTRMLQCRQTPIDAHTRPTSIHVIRNQPVANQKVENYSNGILKNGSSSRSSRPSFSKSSEKSISFGN